MALIVKETPARSILSRSEIHAYVLNPYTGCQRGCAYCYSRFVKRVTGRRDPWGEFVDVKVIAADRLRAEIARKFARKKRPERVWFSGVCDSYRPLEARYRSPGCAWPSWPSTAGRSPSRPARRGRGDACLPTRRQPCPPSAPASHPGRGLRRQQPLQGCQPRRKLLELRFQRPVLGLQPGNLLRLALRPLVQPLHTGQRDPYGIHGIDVDRALDPAE